MITISGDDKQEELYLKIVRSWLYGGIDKSGDDAQVSGALGSWKWLLGRENDDVAVFVGDLVPVTTRSPEPEN